MKSAAAALVALALLAPVIAAEADPYWLRSWEEAQKSRPQSMASVGRIAPESEPGLPLVVHGRVFEPDGRTPAAGVVVHAYHRDANGLDFGPNDSTTATWRLQGWVKSDDEGRFEFSTIRPEPDAMGREGPHIHFTLESPTHGRQWAPTLFFDGDAKLTREMRRRSAAAGAFGWIRPVRQIGITQHVDVQIRLEKQGQF
jgi:protocatechuate 3,4-dioxygenase beta subunit